MSERARPPQARRARRRGFTLIELLVAITILAVVAVLGWRGLDSIIRSRVALTGEMEQTRGLQLAFAQLQSDCEHFVSGNDVQFRKTLVADPLRLTLVRSVFADNQPTRLQVVSYRLRDGVLSRRESAATRDLAVLDTMWQAALDDTETAPAVPLQADVTTLAILQWQSDGPGWHEIDTGTSSSSAGAAAQTLSSARATGLQVTLGLKGQSGGIVKAFLLGAV